MLTHLITYFWKYIMTQHVKLNRPTFVQLFQKLVQFDLHHFPNNPVTAMQWLEMNILSGPFKEDALEALNLALGVTVEAKDNCNVIIAYHDRYECELKLARENGTFAPTASKAKEEATKAKLHKKALESLQRRINESIDQLAGL